MLDGLRSLALDADIVLCSAGGGGAGAGAVDIDEFEFFESGIGELAIVAEMGVVVPPTRDQIGVVDNLLMSEASQLQPWAGEDGECCDACWNSWDRIVVPGEALLDCRRLTSGGVLTCLAYAASMPNCAHNLRTRVVPTPASPSVGARSKRGRNFVWGKERCEEVRLADAQDMAVDLGVECGSDEECDFSRDAGAMDRLVVPASAMRGPSEPVVVVGVHGMEMDKEILSVASSMCGGNPLPAPAASPPPAALPTSGGTTPLPSSCSVTRRSNSTPSHALLNRRRAQAHIGMKVARAADFFMDNPAPPSAADMLCPLLPPMDCGASPAEGGALPDSEAESGGESLGKVYDVVAPQLLLPSNGASKRRRGDWCASPCPEGTSLLELLGVAGPFESPPVAVVEVQDEGARARSAAGTRLRLGAELEDEVTVGSSPGCAVDELRGEFRGAELSTGDMPGDKPSGDVRGGLEPEDEVAMGGTPGAEDSGAGGEGRKSRKARERLRSRQREKDRKRSGCVDLANV